MPAGIESLTTVVVTADGPLLATVIVYERNAPAGIVDADAVLLMERSVWAATTVDAAVAVLELESGSVADVGVTVAMFVSVLPV